MQFVIWGRNFPLFKLNAQFLIKLQEIAARKKILESQDTGVHQLAFHGRNNAEPAPAVRRWCLQQSLRRIGALRWSSTREVTSTVVSRLLEQSASHGGRWGGKEQDKESCDKCLCLVLKGRRGDPSPRCRMHNSDEGEEAEVPAERRSPKEKKLQNGSVLGMLRKL